MTGETQGAAVPSVQNAQKFWRSVACQLFQQVHVSSLRDHALYRSDADSIVYSQVFWYAYQDYNDKPSFGVFDSNGNAIYDLYGC